MTYQEVLWQHKDVRLVSIRGKQGPIHWELAKYCGMPGVVIREAKNGMLLVRFGASRNEAGDMCRAVPASCVVEA